MRYSMAAGMILAWMISPESLTLFNTIGANFATSGGAVIVAGFLLALAGMALLHDPRRRDAGYDSDFKLLQNLFSTRGSMMVILGGRMPLLLFGATGMLVSAGFVFNEVFLYWFPNFLFAILVLMVIAALHLFAPRYAIYLQLVASGIACSGLLLLALAGFLQYPDEQVRNLTGVAAISFPVACTVLVPFMAFDLVRPTSRGIVGIGMTVGFAVLLLWFLAGAGHVDRAVLAEASIAHVFIATAIAGEIGRSIMGGIVILGAFACVSALFQALREMMADPAMSGKPFSSKWLERVVVAVSAIAIGGMMLAGVAGHDYLEVQIQASIALWGLSVGFRMLAISLFVPKIAMIKKGLGCGVAALFLISFGVLVWNDQPRYQLQFMAVTYALSLLFAFYWEKGRTKRNQI